MEPEKWITLNIDMVDLANIIQWLYMYKGQLDSVLGMKTCMMFTFSFIFQWKYKQSLFVVYF